MKYNWTWKAYQCYQVIRVMCYQYLISVLEDMGIGVGGDGAGFVFDLGEQEGVGGAAGRGSGNASRHGKSARAPEKRQGA